MYHLVDNFQTKTGDALVGYYVKLKDSEGTYATLYSDTSLTPISTVSGVADAAVTDATGLYDIYVDDGSYDIEFFDKNDISVLVLRIPDVPMYSNTNVDAAEAQTLATLAASGGSALVGFIQSQTGAVSRTLQARGRDTVSVLDFIPVAEHADIIADATTSADDLTAYIQDALDTGKDVFFPNGTYWVNGSTSFGLQPVSNQKLIFEAEVKIKVIPNALDTYNAFWVIDVENVTFEGRGEIIGERDDHTGPGTDEHGFGIGIKNSTNITVRELRFRDFHGDGVYVGGEDTATVTETLASVTRDVPIQLGETIMTGGIINMLGVSPTTADGVVVEVGGVAKTYSSDYTIDLTNATITILSSGSIAAGADVDVTFGHHGFSRNVLIDNITVDNSYRNGVSITAVDGCIVRGGKFTGSNGLTGGECGIDVEPNSGKAAVKNVLLDGPTCVDNDGPGIAVSIGAENVEVHKAHCCSNAGSGLSVGKVGHGFKALGGAFNENGEYGIVVFGDGQNITMDPIIDGAVAHSNTLDGIMIGANVMRWSVVNFEASLNGRHGVRAARVNPLDDTALGTYCDIGTISGLAWNNSQTTDATYDNIHVGVGCHYVTVESCKVRKNEMTSFISNVAVTPTNQPRYGINAVENEVNFIVHNDVVNGGATANINIGGANVSVRRNKGFKTENRVLSNTFAVDAVATPTITIAHGCAYTPSTHHCQLTIVDASANAFSVGKVAIQSVDATNVTARVQVTSAAAASSTARLALSVERPSAL